jgi:hypothetical protein
MKVQGGRCASSRQAKQVDDHQLSNVKHVGGVTTMGLAARDYPALSCWILKVGCGSNLRFHPSGSHWWMTIYGWRRKRENGNHCLRSSLIRSTSFNTVIIALCFEQRKIRRYCIWGILCTTMRCPYLPVLVFQEGWRIRLAVGLFAMGRFRWGRSPSVASF